MRSIVMTAGCSGCGTAAVTAAVARQLALQGKKVLLVEATAGLRRMNRLLEIREEGLFDFSDLLEGRCALENALLPTRIAGLTLLQGPSAIDWVPEAVPQPLQPAVVRSIVMTAGCSGCGTAAVTAAVARQLALQGKKVLLVEATAGLRRMNRLLEIREEGLFDFSDLLEGRCALENALLPTRIAGLTLLQGPSAIDWVPEAADVQLLREELSGTEQYDALLWYCPPGAGALQKGLLPAAETLVLLTEVTPQSIEAAAKTADWWAGQGARNLRTVFNRVGRRLPRDLGYPHLDAVLDAIGARLLGMIPEGADLPYSAATGNIAARLCGESRPLLAVYRP